MGTNYIPFAVREVMILAANTVQAAKITSLAVSSRQPDAHTIWQDINVWEPSKFNEYSETVTPLGFDNDLFMRYGQKNRGYLLDRPIPVGVFASEGRPMHPTWKFDRPYTIYPGEALSARIITGGIPQADPQGSLGDRTSAPGIVFNCVREKDGQPHILHDSIQELLDVGLERSLHGTFLKCPSDSPVKIYGVSHHQWFNYDSDATNTQPLGIEIFGPNGQSWIHIIVDPATTLNAQHIIGAWIDPPTSLIGLGSDLGWRTPAGSPLAIEFENRSSASKEFVLTVRGFAEVEDE